MSHDSSHEEDEMAANGGGVAADQLDYDNRCRKMWETKSIDLVLSPPVHVHEIKSGSIRELNGNNSNAWKRNSVPGSDHSGASVHRRSFTERYTSSYDDSENGNDCSGEDSGWESHGRQSSARGSPAAESNGSGQPTSSILSSSAAAQVPMALEAATAVTPSFHNQFSHRPHRHSSTFDYYSSNHALNGDWEFNANRFDEQLHESTRLNLAPHHHHHHHPQQSNGIGSQNLRPSRHTVHYGGSDGIGGVRFEKLQYYDDAMETGNNKSPTAANRSRRSPDKSTTGSRKKLNCSSQTQLADDKSDTKSKSSKDGQSSSSPSMKFPLLKSFKSASMRLPGQKSSMQEVQQILRNKFNRLQSNLRKRRALSVQEVFNDDDDGGVGMDRRSQSGSSTDLPNTTFYVPSPSSSIRLKGASSTYIRNSLQDSMEDQNNNIEYHDFNNPHYRLNEVDEDSGPVSLPYFSAASFDPPSSAATSDSLSKRIPSQVSLVEERKCTDGQPAATGHRSRFSDLSFIRGTAKFMNRDSSGGSSLMSKLTRSNSQKVSGNSGSTVTLVGNESTSRANSCKVASVNLHETPKKTARTKLSALFQNATTSSSPKSSVRVKAAPLLDPRSSVKVTPATVRGTSTAGTPISSSTPVAPKRQPRGTVKTSPPTTVKAKVASPTGPVTAAVEDRKPVKSVKSTVAERVDGAEVQKNRSNKVNESAKSKMRIRIRPRSHSPVKQFKHEASKMADGIKRESLGLLNNMYNKLVGSQLPPVVPGTATPKKTGAAATGGTTQNGNATNITKKLKRLSLDSSHSPKALEITYKKIQPPATSVTGTAGNASTSSAVAAADKTEEPSSRDRKLKQVNTNSIPG